MPLVLEEAAPSASLLGVAPGWGEWSSTLAPTPTYWQNRISRPSEKFVIRFGCGPDAVNTTTDNPTGSFNLIVRHDKPSERVRDEGYRLIPSVKLTDGGGPACEGGRRRCHSLPRALEELGAVNVDEPPLIRWT